MLACNVFEKVQTHYHEEVTGVFFQETFVIADILMIRLCDALPKGYLCSILVCRIYHFTVIIGYEFTELLLFEY